MDVRSFIGVTVTGAKGTKVENANYGKEIIGNMDNYKIEYIEMDPDFNYCYTKQMSINYSSKLF